VWVPQTTYNSDIPDLYMAIIRVLPVPLGSLTLSNKSSHGSTKLVEMTRSGQWHKNWPDSLQLLS
jgi:hypothetical protein